MSIKFLTKMMVFVIPVKSEKVSSDWSKFSLLVDRCLRSVCQQTNENFKVVVSCHEIPDVSYKDKRIYYHQVDFNVPVIKENDYDGNYLRKERDKGKKILEGVMYAKQFNPSHVMTVDSDDCISNKICDFVVNAPNHTPGWYFKKGYVYKEGKNYAFLNRKGFHTLCGSSVIVKPDLIEKMYKGDFHFDHSVIDLKNDQKLLPLPFPGAIYSMANGTNHVMTDKGMKNHNNKFKFFSIENLKSLYRKFSKYRFKFATKNFRDTFYLHEVKL